MEDKFKKKCYIDPAQEDIYWWNRFSDGCSGIFHVESAGVTHPHANYFARRSRNSDTFDRLYVVEYVVSGKGYIESEGLTQEVSAGDLYIICRKTIHCYYADREDPFEKKWINISGKFLNSIMPTIVGDRPFGVFHLGEPAEEIMDRIHERVKKVAPNGSEEMYSDVMKLLLDLLWLIDRRKREAQSSMPIEDRIVQYIDKNICLDITVTDICDSFYISTSTLYRVFKEKFDMSPKQFITEKKIEAAKRMIASNIGSVNSIAASLNFYDTHHFVRTFQRQTGMTPAEYRKEMLK